MALDFSATSTAHVNHGSAAALDDIQAGTLLLWIRPTTSSALQTLLRKGVPGANITVWITASGLLEAFITRSSGFLTARALLSSFSAWALNSQMFLAVTWNVNGTNADQTLRIGSVSAEAAEPSAYDLQTVGSGTIGSNASNDLFICNNSATATAHFQGGVSFVGIWNRVLSHNEIVAQQWMPEVTSGAVLHCHYFGSDSSAQVDEAGANHGTPANAQIASTQAPYALPWSPQPPTAAGAAGGNVVGAQLVDTFTFADTVSTDATVIYDITEGDDTATFEDELFSQTQSSGGGAGKTVTVTLIQTLNFSDGFNRNPAVDRILSN